MARPAAASRASIDSAWAGLSALLLAACTSSTPTPTYRVEDLGIPQTKRAVIAATVCGDTLFATLFETKGVGRLLVRPLAAGPAREWPMAGTTGAYALACDETDGSVYVGTFRRAGVWRFAAGRPPTPIHTLDERLAGDSHVFALALAGRTLYAGSYPSGRLLRVDLATGAASDLGQAVPGRVYLRQLAIGADDRVFAATGSPPAVAAWDPRTHRFEILIEGEAQDGAIAAFTAEHGRLVAIAGGQRLALPAAPTKGVVSVSEEGAFSVDGPGGPVRGTLDLAPKQDGMMTMGLFSGPDGVVYGATYWNHSLFAVRAGGLEALGRVAKASGEFRVGGVAGPRSILLPGYTGTLHLFDLDRPPSTEPAAENPRHLGTIGHGQHLATAVARHHDGALAIATPPSYGLQGGALTVFAPRSRTWRTLTGLAGPRSIAAVAFDAQGLLVAGTSNEVGLGAEGLHGPARLLVVEPASGRVLHDVAPVPEAESINALVRLDDLRLLGGTSNGRLFVFHTRRRSARLLDARLGQVRDLVPWPADGSIAGVAWGQGVFRIVPGVLKPERVPGSPPRLMPGMAVDGAGRLHVHDGTRVFRIVPPDLR